MKLSIYPVVSSREELEVVLLQLKRVVNLAARLPDSPFLSDEGTDSFCQFESFRAGSFGPLLEALANQFHDEFISGALLDPHYYLDNEDIRGNFAAFHIPAERVSEQYWRALTYEPNDNPADSMYGYSNVLCVAGSSGSWAIWGERTIGVGIVRTVGTDVSWRGDSDWFVSVTEAIDAFIEPNFDLQPISSTFREKLLSNVRPSVGSGAT
jgi:hypothetical protein